MTEKGRNKRKRYLDNKDNRVDFILALDTCKEGFDWDAAERSIILGERHSIPEMIQMIGRLFRPCPGKTHAEVFQILPAAISNCEKFKDQQNSILTVIFSAMLLEEVFLPNILTAILDDPKTRKRHRPDRLIDLFPNTEVFEHLRRDFQAAVMGRDYDTGFRVMCGYFKRRGILKHKWKEIYKSLWVRCGYLIQKQKGLKLNVPFEFYKTMDITPGS